jgi:hypothetical protein
VRARAAIVAEPGFLGVAGVVADGGSERADPDAVGGERKHLSHLHQQPNLHLSSDATIAVSVINRDQR